MYAFHSTMSLFRGHEAGVKHAEAYVHHAKSTVAPLP